MCPRGSVLDTPVDADFALKAQTYYDKYVESCSTGRIEGDYYCKSRRKATVEGTRSPTPASARSSTTATGALREKIGKLAPDR